MINSRKYVVRVSRKGQVVIPAEVRRKLGIRDRVYLIVYNNRVELVPVRNLKELIGLHREVMLEIAKEIVEERKRELVFEEK